MYFALTGRNAYPARDFKQVREYWQIRPPLPSELVQDIPKALDALVMSLMHLERTARPANAAEVMERLAAIADIPIDAQLLVSEAYLSTPTLVGREKTLRRLRKYLDRTQRGRGGVLTIRGASGVGRTRFMNACVLEGKLMGATVLHADASEAHTGEYAIARSLARQLLETAPEEATKAAAPRAGVLGHILPELVDTHDAAQLQEFEEPDQLRPRLQRELRDWFFEVSQQRRLLLVVDDVHLVDEPSAAFVAFLAHKADEHPVVVAVSAETDASSASDDALKLLSDSGRSVELKNLRSHDTEELLGSVFGQVPNLQLVAHPVHIIARGNPRDVMRLAQHLVDKELAHCRAGTWSLPDRIDVGDLPRSMAQALTARVEALSDDARFLARTMALSPERRFSVEDCRLLAEHGESGRLLGTLDELLAAEVLKRDGEQYAIAQAGWVSALKDAGDPEQERASHLRLAALFEACRHEQLRVAHHLLRAGEEERGLDALIDFSAKSMEATVKDAEAYSKLIHAFQPEFFEAYAHAIDVCKKLDRPVSQFHTLRSRLSGLAWISHTCDTTYVRDLIRQLHEDSGLGFYERLGDSVSPDARLSRALELAQQRFDQSAEEQRGVQPLAAIRQMAQVCVEVAGGLVASWDLSLWDALPSLKPLVPLSPALDVVERTVGALGNRLAGRYEITCAAYREILQRISEPDRAGLDVNHHKHVRLAQTRALGALEAAMGLHSTPALAKQLQEDSKYETGALEMRMLYHLWQGDTERARDTRRQMELLRIQQNPLELHKNSYLSLELTAYALADDLTGVKSLLDSTRKMAKMFRAWVPVLHYAQGEYQRIRGDHSSALRELEQALALTEPGRHQNWADIAGAHLRTLLELDRCEEVAALGEQVLEAAEGAQLGYLCNYLKMPLAIAQAKLGQYDRAVERSQAAVNYFDAMGATGINLGLACHARARVANAMKDVQAHEEYARRCAEQFCSKGTPALTAMYETLTQESQDREIGLYSESTEGTDLGSLNHQSVLDRLTRELQSRDGAEERAMCILDHLVERSNALGGLLYVMQEEGVSRVAQSAVCQPTQEMESMVEQYMAAQLRDVVSATMTHAAVHTDGNANTGWTSASGDKYYPVLLSHNTTEGFAVTGVALLLMDPRREFKFPGNMLAPASTILEASGDACTRIGTVYT